MKALEEKTLDEIVASGSKEDLEAYYSYLASMKTNSFYKDIVESYEGDSLAEIYDRIREEELMYRSELFFPGDIVKLYPRIREQKARDYITCDFSAGIIYPGSIYVNYRPMLRNITTGETYVLQRTIKVEAGYRHDLPHSIIELESLEHKLQIDNYYDNSGIAYSHLRQCLGGEIYLKKLKRRKQ